MNLKFNSQKGIPCGVRGLRLCGVGGALAFSLLWPSAARAQRPGTVAVGGEYVLTIRYPAGGMSVQQRADAVTERLTTILGDPNIRPSDIVARPQGRNAVVKVKNRLLVTIDRRTARAFDQTPLQRAQTLAARLGQLLPRINIKPNPNLESVALPKR